MSQDRLGVGLEDIKCFLFLSISQGLNLGPHNHLSLKNSGVRPNQLGLAVPWGYIP